MWGGTNYKFNSNDYFIYIGNNHRKDQKEPETGDINTKLNKGDTEGREGREGEEQGETDIETDLSRKSIEADETRSPHRHAYTRAKCAL